MSLLKRRPISSSNDTHEVVKTQRGMLCKVSGGSDRKTHSLLLFLLSVDMCCGVVCFLSCAVTLHNAHCWMLLRWLKKTAPSLSFSQKAKAQGPRPKAKGQRPKAKGQMPKGQKAKRQKHKQQHKHNQDEPRWIVAQRRLQRNFHLSSAFAMNHAFILP